MVNIDIDMPSISQVTLNSYSFENVAFHVLHERIPLYTFRTLSDWWDLRTSLNRWRTVDHYVRRCRGNVRILESVDFIGRTSELARLFGILFFSVICRGSQVFLSYICYRCMMKNLWVCFTLTDLSVIIYTPINCFYINLGVSNTCEWTVGAEIKKATNSMLDTREKGHYARGTCAARWITRHEKASTRVPCVFWVCL